jgi:hypothetical protein
VKLIQDGGNSSSENRPEDGVASDDKAPTFAELIAAAMALIGKSVKGSKRRYRYAVGIAIVLAAAGALGYPSTEKAPSNSELRASPVPSHAPVSSMAPPSTGSVSPTRMVHRVGGVGLQSYCQGFGFTAFDYSPAQVVCRSDVDLVAACIREHPKATKFTLQDPGNLKTGSCYDRRGTILGDIKDMSGYCRDRHRLGDKTDDNPVHAEDIVGQGWQCRMPADVSAACAGQYNDRSLAAEYRDKEWGCYKPE